MEMLQIKDARKERYESVEILGIPGLFSIYRIDRATVPKGMFLYELKSAAADWTQPCAIAERIDGNFYGSVLTASPIPPAPQGSLKLKPGDFMQNDPHHSMTAAEFEDRCFNRCQPRRERRTRRAALCPSR